MKRIMAGLLALAATLAQAQVPAPRYDPARGQTAETQATDLTECGRWSEQQTGYSLRTETAAAERDRQVLDEPLPPGPAWSATDRARTHVALLVMELQGYPAVLSRKGAESRRTGFEARIYSRFG